VQLSLRYIAGVLNGDVHGDGVRAPGPKHSLNDRSLSIKISDDGTDVVVNSFSPKDDRLACLAYVREKCGIQPKPKVERFSEADIERAVTMAAAARRPNRKAIATYNYDVDGVTLYQKRRYHDPNHKFDCWQPDGKGGWINGMRGVDRRVLYRLSDVLQGGTVFFCEGERDADNLNALGLCTTTIVGAGSWTDECVQALKERDVVIMRDNDDAGIKRAQEAAEHLHGVASRLRMCLLPDLPPKGDVTDWIEAGGTVDQLQRIIEDVPDWASTDVPAPTTNAVALASNVAPAVAAPKLPTVAPLCFVKIEDWLDRDPPQREWGVLDRFPLRNVSLISGEGSVGKSLLIMQLASAHIYAKGWLDTLPEPGDALYLNAEDEADELWRRFADLATFYEQPLSDLKGHLHLLSYAGKDAVLAHASKSGTVKATPLFDRLVQAAGDLKPKLIGLDTSADIFAGAENDRTQVRQFIGLLRGMSIAGNSSVIVCTHPSLTGISSGTGLSGSTAWHNSVRARAYLRKVTAGDVEPDHTLRQLDFMKSNYGPIATSVTIRWKNGVYVMEAKPGSLEALAADAKADEVFTALLTTLTEQGRNVSDRPTSHNYAPTVFAAERRAKEANIKKPGLVAAMRRLFDARKIRVDNYGRPSRPYSRIVSC
jgi:RecA-family ATPase